MADFKKKAKKIELTARSGKTIELEEALELSEDKEEKLIFEMSTKVNALIYQVTFDEAAPLLRVKANDEYDKVIMKSEHLIQLWDTIRE